MEELEYEPCPFCGEDENLEIIISQQGAYVECRSCLAEGPLTVPGEDIEERAAEQWGRRTEDW